MGCSSKVRRIRRAPVRTPTALGSVPIPDPRTWPSEVREQISRLRGNCSPLDICIFVSGRTAAMYLQDAVTAIGVLDVDPSEWQTEGGYPALCFDAKRVPEYESRLRACGYAVRVGDLRDRPAESTSTKAPRAQVIDIARARSRRKTL